MKKQFILLLCIFFVFCFNSKAQEIDANLDRPDGVVNSIVREGNLLFVGGQFNHFGKRTGGAGLTSLSNNSVIEKLPNIVGQVFAVASDNKGGWFIGGDLYSVGGEEVHNLAHINGDGSLDNNWKPVSDYEVYSLAVVDGKVLAGGSYPINNTQLAVIDPITGKIADIQINLSATADKIIVTDEAIFILDLLQITKLNRKTLAKIQNWQIILDQNVQLYDMAVSGNTLYVSGNFAKIQGQTRNKLAAVNIQTAELLPWNPIINTGQGSYSYIEIYKDQLFISGNFTTINNQNRYHLASFNVTSGELTNWTPDGFPLTAANIYALTSTGDKLLAAAGSATTDDNFLLDIDMNSGKITQLPASPDAGVACIAASSDEIFWGGDFKIFNSNKRKNLAVLNALSGKLLPWNPAPDRPVNCLAVENDILYVGGEFSQFAGQTRTALAAVDINSLKLTSWNPNIDVVSPYIPSNVPLVTKILPAGDRIFILGKFSAVNNKDRWNIASLRTSDAGTTDWQLTRDGIMYENNALDMAISGNTIYLSGSYVVSSTTTIENLIAADAITGVSTTKLSNFYGINYISIFDNKLYGLGSESIGYTDGNTTKSVGQLVGIDLNNYTLLNIKIPQVIAEFNYNKFTFNKIVATEKHIFFCGNFNKIGDFYRGGVASVFRSDGEITPWNPKIYFTQYNSIIGEVKDVSVTQNKIYVGGTIISNYALFENLASYNYQQNNRYNIVNGTLFSDKNKDCIIDKTELGLKNITIIAQPGNFWASTNSDGTYKMVLDTGTFTIRPLLENSKGLKIVSTCALQPPKFVFKTYNNEVSDINFGYTLEEKYYLEIKISSVRRRRCFRNASQISYSNSGFASSENTKVYVKLPEYVIFKSADLPFTKDKDGNYVFDIGTLAPNQSGTINIIDSVACINNITGLTQCTKVWITPANNNEIKPSWDRSDITLKAKCLDNGFVKIGIYNTGSGNMKDSTEYRIFINAQLALKRNFKLNQNDSLVLKIPANGRTIRLEADEPKDHPNKTSTNISIENCGTAPNAIPVTGFVNQLPQDDTEPEVSIQCLPILDSYDPNDKQVLPSGTTVQHFTPTDAELQYQIRFQNTGTDTAYTVTVIDTLSDNLDIATLQVGASSHKYTFNVSGKGKPVLTWTFNNINLPDSTKDRLKSNGFISFSIKAKTGLPAQTKIENYADIIFDYNDPVRTNTTFNTIYDVPPVVVSAVKLDEKAIIPLPIITSFSPIKAKVGETITLKGKNFEKNLVDNILKINKVPAVIESVNDSILVFKVPASALSGKINLKTNYGLAASSTDFIVLYPPVITSFSPDKGIPGDKITITGSNFDEITANNTVKFGSLSAQVLSANANTLEVKVPSGFYQAKIAVTTPVGNAVSGTDFTMLLTATENLPENNLAIYPNPTDGKIMIDFGTQPVKVLEISVLNSIGSLVLLKKVQKTVQKEELDLSDKPAGIYLLLLKTETGSLSRKVVIR